MILNNLKVFKRKRKYLLKILKKMRKKNMMISLSLRLILIILRLGCFRIQGMRNLDQVLISKKLKILDQVLNSKKLTILDS